MDKQINKFYEEPDILKYQSKILRIKPEDNGIWVLPAVNYFYPGGGGQERDWGTINNIPVVDIDKIEHHYWFKLSASTSIKTDMTYSFEIDAGHRLASMQSHSAQHLASAVLYREFRINTVSVHLNDSYFTIETDVHRISAGDIEKLLEICNSHIREALPVYGTVVEENELEKLDIRRPAKTKSNIRIVHIGEYDRVPCGGLHVKKTSQIQSIHFLKSESIRGHTRIHFTAGSGAYQRFRENQKIVLELQDMLSAQPGEIITRVKELWERSTLLQSQLSNLIDMWLDAHLNTNSGTGLKIVFLPPEMNFKQVAKMARKKDNHSFLLYQNDSGLFYIKFHGEDSPEYKIVQSLREKNQIRGGGKFPFFQGQLAPEFPESEFLKNFEA